ncbi:MAG: putative DNA modification/repair radical SAM protein [Eubacteriales bacterium]|nr:putative DNA modification/repair radical SAM protein [Eubacteriales bacterium]
MLIQQEMDVQEKLRILADAARFDVACTSSGSDRGGRKDSLGNTCASGICHSFSSDGRCISLLKILFTNQCIHDCRYCINRRSNDVVRTAFTPEEVCRLTMEFYRRNYIEGLFLSSGILHSPDYTMSLLYETLRLLRGKYRFNGYIHVKAIPGADPSLVEQAGFLADRMSVNLELPTAEGLRRLAPGKSRERILGPMRQVQKGIAAQNLSLLENGGGAFVRTGGRETGMADSMNHPGRNLWSGLRKGAGRVFVPAGQSTQMIVGATPESDYQMIRVAEALYQNYDLKRVFYSAFVRVNEDSLLPVLPGGPPLLREHRLYQADWLLRFYGFQAGELLTEDRPNFNVLLDPKCDWALRHLEQFPVEISRADYGTLLRVPGIGVKSARRILAARKSGALDFADLKKLGVVLKRAVYFITCAGRQMYPVRMEENFIAGQLIGEERRKTWEIGHHDNFRQMSLFDDYRISAPVTAEDRSAALAGQL